MDDLKAQLRARMRGVRPADPVAASVAAQERLAGTAQFRSARMVALYRALPSECGTAVLASLAPDRVCYPVIVPGKRALQFRRGTGAFVRGALGIEEPLSGSPVDLAAVDLLVVPAVAVDLRGRRLGRGRGHYDATLAAFTGFSVALVFESQLVPEVPVGEHDRPVSAVCTEARFVTA